MLKPIFLCADDFGLNPGVNQGILALAHQGRLSATSCMSLAPAFAQDATALAQTPIATGLHLSLTEPGASQWPAQKLRQVIARSLLRQWSIAELKDEIQRQLDAFEDTMQRAPHHVDGHQHIHALPMIREVLLEELQKRYGSGAPVLRSTRDGGGAPTLRDAFKAKVIQALGSSALLRQATQHHLSTSHALLGVYGFDADESLYLAHLQRWMQAARPDDLIMCHPAISNSAEDALGEQRVVEYRVLAGTQLPSILHALNAQIVPGVPTMKL